jgi:hypothetical protein
MRIPSRSSVYFTLSSVLVLVSFATAVGQTAGTASFYRSADRLGRVLQRINDAYVEEIPPDTLVDAAIRGLSTVLDPHTSYFAEKEVDDLKVHTEGEFGGLGITIGVRENVLTVISPLDGTPAQRMGIQAGDRIVEIDGKSTRGITVDDVFLAGTRTSTRSTNAATRGDSGFFRPSPWRARPTAATSRSATNRSCAKALPLATTSPVWSTITLQPSKTSSSCPPTVFV